MGSFVFFLAEYAKAQRYFYRVYFLSCFFCRAETQRHVIVYIFYRVYLLSCFLVAQRRRDTRSCISFIVYIFYRVFWSRRDAETRDRVYLSCKFFIVFFLAETQRRRDFLMFFWSRKGAAPVPNLFRKTFFRVNLLI